MPHMIYALSQNLQEAPFKKTSRPPPAQARNAHNQTRDGTQTSNMGATMVGARSRGHALNGIGSASYDLIPVEARRRASGALRTTARPREPAPRHASSPSAPGCSVACPATSRPLGLRPRPLKAPAPAPRHMCAPTTRHRALRAPPRRMLRGCLPKFAVAPPGALAGSTVPQTAPTARSSRRDCRRDRRHDCRRGRRRGPHLPPQPTPVPCVQRLHRRRLRSVRHHLPGRHHFPGRRSARRRWPPTEAASREAPRESARHRPGRSPRRRRARALRVVRSVARVCQP